MKMECNGCGADFGRVDVGRTESLSTTLGNLLAGASFTHWSAACEYSDLKVMSSTSFNTTQHVVLKEVEKLFDEFIQTHNDQLHGEPERKLRVRTEDHFFIRHKDRLVDLVENSDFGKEVRGEGFVLTLGCWLLCRPFENPVGCFLCSRECRPRDNFILCRMSKAPSMVGEEYGCCGCYVSPTTVVAEESRETRPPTLTTLTPSPCFAGTQHPPTGSASSSRLPSWKAKVQHSAGRISRRIRWPSIC